MANLIGKSATVAHMALIDMGYHEDSTSMNSSVIFLIYGREGVFVTLMVDAATHEVMGIV